MSAILIRNARVLTMRGRLEVRPPPEGRRGDSLGELGIIPSAEVLIANGRVESILRTGSVLPPAFSTASLTADIDARGRILMPGFVDCHTHACWAGSRLDEWEQKLAGASYQQIMARGGGIMSSVRATRAATKDDLAASLRERTGRMLRLGSTTIEVKSGYGLTAEHELKMLGAIAAASQMLPTDPRPTIVPTALLGHALDPDSDPREFVERTIDQTLPQVSAAFPGIPVDAFCERGSWDLSECFRLFTAAKERGHPVRVHADQFTSLGMTEWAVNLSARSVDHLEASTLEAIKALAESETFAVGLPVCGFHLDSRYARLGEIARLGGKVCIATNDNPGSAPCPSMAFAAALAVRHCGLTPAQAIVASTLNPACLLGFTDRGYIAPGARADLALLRHTDERALVYEVGDNPVETVIADGVIVE